MARNDAKKATAYTYNSGEGSYTNSTDVFKWCFVTDTYASIDEDATSLDLSDLTVVPSAGAYVANTTIASTTWVQTAGVVALDGADFSFAANGSNPVTGKCLVIYNDTSAADDVYAIIDMTIDGTTAVDTTQGFTYTVAAGGIGNVTVNP